MTANLELSEELDAPATTEVPAHLEKIKNVRVKDATRIIGVSKSKLYEMMDAGDIASVRIGTSRRIPLDALEQFMQRLRAV